MKGEYGIRSFVARLFLLKYLLTCLLRHPLKHLLRHVLLLLISVFEKYVALDRCAALLLALAVCVSAPDGLRCNGLIGRCAVDWKGNRLLAIDADGRWLGAASASASMLASVSVSVFGGCVASVCVYLIVAPDGRVVSIDCVASPSASAEAFRPVI